jgi:hypothetical protein
MLCGRKSLLRNETLQDAAYAGQPISRADLEADASVDGLSAEEEDDEAMPFGPVASGSATSEASEESAVESEENVAPARAESRQDDTQAMIAQLRKAKSADVEKGQHVRKQLASEIFWLQSLSQLCTGFLRLAAGNAHQAAEGGCSGSIAADSTRERMNGNKLMLL